MPVAVWQGSGAKPSSVLHAVGHTGSQEVFRSGSSNSVADGQRPAGFRGSKAEVV